MPCSSTARSGPCDKSHPEAQAIAVWHGRILKVGTDAEVKRLAGPKTKVIDLDGPARRAGLLRLPRPLPRRRAGTLAEVDLKDAKDEAEFGRRLAEFDKKTPRGPLDPRRRTGTTTAPSPASCPTAAMLDKYVKDRPVFIRRYDGHMALANSAAPQARGHHRRHQGPARRRHLPPAGRQDARPAFCATTRCHSSTGYIPEPDDAEILEAVLARLEARGRSSASPACRTWTAAFATTRRTALPRLPAARPRGQTHLPHRSALAAGAVTRNSRHVGVEADFGDDFVRIGGVKGFMDGSLGTSTAKMFEPYVNEPRSTGVYVTRTGRDAGARSARPTRPG